MRADTIHPYGGAVLQRAFPQVLPLEGELAAQPTEEVGRDSCSRGNNALLFFAAGLCPPPLRLTAHVSPAGSVPVWLSMSTGHRFTTKPRFAPPQGEGQLRGAPDAYVTRKKPEILICFGEAERRCRRAFPQVLPLEGELSAQPTEEVGKDP